MTRIAFTLLFLSFSAIAFMENQFLSVEQADHKWGHAPFSVEKFVKGTPAERAALAVDLIKKEKFVGQKLADVKKTLGVWDGRYETGRLPAYKLGAEGDQAYTLVFLPDYSGKMVEDVKIYHEQIESSGSAITATSPRLPITIDGPTAAAVYRQLSAVSEENSKKIGKNISCSNSGGNYRCTFELDENGNAFPK